MTDMLSPTAITVWNYLAQSAWRNRRVAESLVAIVDSTGLDPVIVDGAIDELADAGLATSWTPDADPLATLTPLGASICGLKLRRIREGNASGLAWVSVRRADPECPEKRPAFLKLATDVGLNPGYVVDVAPDPAQVAEVADEIDAIARKLAGKRRLSDYELDPRRLSRPQIILTGCQPWSARVSGPCPACNDAPISRASVYCARCGRWGLDWLLARIWRAIERSQRAGASAAAEVKARTFAERHAKAQ